MKAFSRLSLAALMLQLLFASVCLAGETVWLDVRSADEFSQEHVEQAINIPFDQISEQISSLGLAKGQLIYVYCGSGRRAGIALTTLESLGYSQVINLGGLEDALTKAEAAHSAEGADNP